MNADENTTQFESFEAEDSGDNVTSLTAARQKRKPKAKYADYIQLAIDTLGDIRRDLFSLDMMTWNEGRGRWVPVLQTQSLGRLKSSAHDSSGFYSPSHIENHLLRYEESLVPELLVSLPEWDRIDRIGQIAECIKCKSFSSAFVAELLKDWFARMFLRLNDPYTHQNRILLLQGAEGLGKDWLFRAMLGGLGQFFTGFTVQSQEKDTFDLVCGAAVLNVTEFERLYKSDMGIMKAIITEPEHKYRPSFERKSEFKVARSSFIGTCNRDDILKDSGKNRRYIILDVESIEWAYPQGASLQILAQGRWLAQEGFVASSSAEQCLKTYIEGKTPEALESILIEQYQKLFLEKYGAVKTQSSKMDDLWEILSKQHSKITNVTIRNIIKTAGFGKREAAGIFYWPYVGCTTVDQTNIPSIGQAQHVEHDGYAYKNVEEEIPF